MTNDENDSDFNNFTEYEKVYINEQIKYLITKSIILFIIILFLKLKIVLLKNL